MKKNGKTGRPGKRRRNMPGYRLGVDRIGRKAWLVNRRPQDIAGYISKNDFLSGRVEPGSIFAISKKSNGVFLGIHKGRILYYNPKTDRVAHTGFGRGDQAHRRIVLLKERAGLDYFKSENGWMNHRKIPGSDLRVSDVLTNPYRKTIVKNVGDKFTMLDYHETAVVGDVLLGNQTGLKAEVIGITKRGINVKVDDGTPDGRLGHVNLKNPKYLDRMYTLVKSAVNDDLQVEDLQKKVKSSSYLTVDTDKGGAVAVGRRGRPAGSTNRPLTDEEKQAHRDKMNKYIDNLKNISDDDIDSQIYLTKKVISHANKSEEAALYEQHRKALQQLNYKKKLYEKYDEVTSQEDKLKAAKAVLKYERRMGGRGSAIKMWQDRVNELSGGKELKPIEEEKLFGGKKESQYKKENEPPNQEKSFEDKINDYIEKYKDENDFKEGYKEKELAKYYSDEKLDRRLKEYTDGLKNSSSEGSIANLVGSYKSIKDVYDERESTKAEIYKQVEKYVEDPQFKNFYERAVSALEDLNSVIVGKLSLTSMQEKPTDESNLKRKLAFYKASQDILSKMDETKDAEKYNKQLDLEIEGKKNDSDFINSVKKIKEELRKDEFFNEKFLEDEIEISVMRLKDNDFASLDINSPISERKNLLARLKAVRESLDEKKFESELDEQIKIFEKDPEFETIYPQSVRVLKANEENLTKVGLKKTISNLFRDLYESQDQVQTGSLDLIQKMRISAYKVARELLSGKIKHTHEQTVDEYLIENNSSRSDALYPKLLKNYQDSVLKALDKGVDVSGEIKKTIPMFNTWEADPLTGSGLRDKIKKINPDRTLFDNYGHFLKGISPDNTYEGVIAELDSRIKNLKEQFEEEVRTTAQGNYIPGSVPALDALRVSITNSEYAKGVVNEFYDRSIRGLITNHLNSFEPSNLDYKVKFQTENIDELDKRRLEKVIKKGVDFVKGLLGKRDGEFAVGVFINAVGRTREHYIEQDRRVSLGRHSEEPVVIHEMAHMLEYLYPQAKNMCVDFVKKRTKGDDFKKMKDLFPGAPYDDHERTRPDKFIHPYIGKLYLKGVYEQSEINNWNHDTPNDKIEATEVLSMGLQYLYEKPSQFMAADPEHFDLVWNIMRGGGKWQ